MKNKYDLVYKTQATPFFPICLVGKRFSSNFQQLVNLNLASREPVIVVICNDTVNWFFPKTLSKIGRQVLEKIVSGSKYFSKIKSKEKEISKKLLKEIKTPVKDLFKDKTLTKEGETKIRKTFQYYSDYAYFVDIPGFLFQLYCVDGIKKEVFKNFRQYPKAKKEEFFNLILSSYKKTNYEKFLFKIYEHVLLKKNSKNLEEISKQFYWVIHDYLGEIVDLKYLKKEVERFKKKTEKEREGEIQEIEERLKKIEIIRKELSAKILKKIKIIQEILYLYNERKKEVLNQTNIYFRKIIQYKFPRKNFSEIHQIYQLSPEEMIRLLKGEKIEDLEERSRGWVYSIKNDVIKTSDRKYLKLVVASGKVKILKGTSASLGRIKGRVNIVLNISHIQKFKENDILVAPFTNVNYLPIIKKAKAILTETGGLTSHAAIVSRELKKPCIVGIKNLIASLKDGDLIEVDADRGVVKILKR